jgi:hypothetical protein
MTFKRLRKFGLARYVELEFDLLPLVFTIVHGPCSRPPVLKLGYSL